jgi:hypothetical protein
VPNPFFGQITDSRSVMSNPTVEQQFLLRPMPHFRGTGVGTAEPARGDSNYHALQMKWEKRFSKGLTMLAHYTWSKMIDNISHSSGNVSWLGGSTSLQNIWDLRGERSLSSHDIAHRVVMTGAYELPFGRSQALGRQLEPRSRLGCRRLGVQRYGRHAERYALHVTQSGGAIWDGTQRPNLIGDPSTTGAVTGSSQPVVQHGCLLAAAADVPGSTPRAT